ncbi:MAG: AAA family ATPase [Anaerolineales bacterium]|nr:AAA family ATPase [Anaerolineales bacterium]
MLIIGRDRELALLDRALAAVRRHGQLVVLNGRHGSGKTALVQHWLASRRRRAFVWTAQLDAGELDQATSFAQGLRRHWGLAGDAVRPFALETWRKAFFQLAETGRRIVVIDSDGFAKPR